MSWSAALRRALLTGTVASALSAAMLALCGRIERGTAAGPNNGPSQWVWGERAAYERRPTLRHTAVGYAIHHLMSIAWATLHEKHAMDPAGRRAHGRRLMASAATASLACLVDYRVAPRRLQPGFEKQLGKVSLLLVYAAFAIGLAAAEPLRKGLHRLRATANRGVPRHRIASAAVRASPSPCRTSAHAHGHE